MTKPTFEFRANSAAPEDRSGVAIWRYTDNHRGEDVEIVVRQEFAEFSAAMGINSLLDAAWRLGEAQGYAACQRKVLDAL